MYNYGLISDPIQWLTENEWFLELATHHVIASIGLLYSWKFSPGEKFYPLLSWAKFLSHEF